MMVAAQRIAYRDVSGVECTVRQKRIRHFAGARGATGFAVIGWDLGQFAPDVTMECAAAAQDKYQLFVLGSAGCSTVNRVSMVMMTINL